ncbi:uncharacterized protein LOC128211069 isoform X2 [Mya arenaria]|uniref:uncharacterized protein LOC128211069 isoform X2 n=1 Tax=Mya arenaria TaxID=6604 RepID=UPI0022E15017|nr:uncharacterized protein LOC128211069 isoform X2 [Mya arenaria]
MEFNPLDLLASAAELQQKTDDGTERIILTRQKHQSGTKPSTTVNGQKENREIHNNNNGKMRPKPSVVIVKKMKVDKGQAGLEKMFDEHNYGNAKKSNKFDLLKDDSSELNSNKMRRASSDLDTQSYGRSHVNEVSEVGNRDNTTSPPAHSLTVSHTNNSESAESTCEGKCTCGHSDNKVTCSNACSYTRTENETRDNKCLKCTNNCSCSGNRSLPVEDCDRIEHSKVTNINTGLNDNKDNCSDKVIMRCTNTGSSHNIGVSKQDGDVPTRMIVNRLKLNDKTGEFITQNGAKVIIKSPLNGNIKKSNESLTSEEFKNKAYSNNNGKVQNMVSLKGTKTAKQETSNHKSTSVITSAKMPYVKVMPAKELHSETCIDKKKPETLVINISRGLSSGSNLTKSAGLTNRQSVQSQAENSDTSCHNNNNCEAKISNNVGIIKSIVVNESVNELNKKNSELSTKRKPVIYTMVPNRKPKLEMPDCNSISCQAKSTTCSTLKALDLTDTMCTDDSSTSVHLLSPDRRNPDSMGVVESPVLSTDSDLMHDEPLDVNICDKKQGTILFSTGSDTIGSKLTSDSLETQCEALPTHSENLHQDSAMDLETTGIDSISDTRELMKESRLESTENQDSCDIRSANDLLTESKGNDVPIFRFDSDHCYAGAPGVKTGSQNKSAEIHTDTQTVSAEKPHTQLEEARTPLGSTSELSQDSGYEDTTTQSPVADPPATVVVPTSEKSGVKNLVPVLVSVNSNGSLTLHDSNLSKSLGGKMFAIPENFASGIKLIPGPNFTSLAQPLILSPVGKSTSPVIVEAPKQTPKLVPTRAESILGLLSPQKADLKSAFQLSQSAKLQASPPKVGKFKIGSFASFSNSGMGIESNTPISNMGSLNKSLMPTSALEIAEKMKKPLSRSRSNSGKSSPATDSLGSLVQKVKGNLAHSPVTAVENGFSTPQDHIQHDHDYCTKNLMPTMVTSLLEQRLLQKDVPKSKPVHHGKGKKIDTDYHRDTHKTERSGKRKRLSSSLSKLDSLDDIEVDSESDTQSIPDKPKGRFEKFLEKTRTADPKVKITGSSNFQDQFVYFMNTTKRSRRRESKDSPLPLSGDRVFIPPKPGDIIVPHLTDQDIENLKLRSKNAKNSSLQGSNFLKNEFMAAKLANQQFSAQPTSESADDEKSIINTILSMENDESLASPATSEPPGYNESMEMYGQGIGNESNDIMNLFSEQMNLTQEQMDLLFSAVDEVQNSSPGLLSSDKLSPGSTNPTLSHFPIPEFGATTDLVSTPVPNSQTPGSSETNILGTSQTSVTDKQSLEDNVVSGAQKVIEKSSVAPAVTTAADAIASTTTTTSSSSKMAVTSETTQAVAAGSEPPANLTVLSAATAATAATATTTTTTAPVLSDNTTTTTTAVTGGEPSIQILDEGIKDASSETGLEKESMEVDAHGKETEQVEEVKNENTAPPSPGGSIPQSTEKENVCENLESNTFLTSNQENDQKTLNSDSSSANFNSLPPTPSNTDSGSISQESSLPALADSVSVSEKSLFPSGVGSAATTVVPDLTMTQSTPSLTSDISLSQLDILGNDFKLDGYKSDLFTDTSVPPVSAGSSVGPLTLPQATTSIDFQASNSLIDYQAPWIVTMSMFWNDLPAIMIKNQPFVRLVDIHKQILPAKDTGILKKRCQLMGIRVENCSEMQRYFIVQYGRAINSKSTLIISQENAKELIGYYVNPQPKSSHPSDHKSIIDHRREQLRRIALARRAAMKAQKPVDKKDDPREIHEHKDTSGTDSLLESPKTANGSVAHPGFPAAPRLGATPEVRSQRATRHKKINFLEMLRGDSAANNEEETHDTEKSKKIKNTPDMGEGKKRKQPVERKMKVVRYTIESDSSEETDSVASEYSSSYETDSDCHVTPIRKPPIKQRKLGPPIQLNKPKPLKVKTFPSKTFIKGLKVKIRPNSNKSRPVATSTPNAVQDNGKSKAYGLQGVKVGKYQSLTPLGLSKKLVDKAKEGSHTVEVQTAIESEESVEEASPATFVDNLLSSRSASVEMSEVDLKVSPTLPDEILESSDRSENIEHMENTDAEKPSASQPEYVHMDVESIGLKQLSDSITESKPQSTVENRLCANEIELATPHTPMSISKRKDSVQIGSEEVPLRVVHRDASPQAEPRTRSQLGEVFVDHYHNKKSMCVRCYTCRRLLSVDNFLQHLHDNSGLIQINSPRTIDTGEYELNEKEQKLWETFQRKKELFDNNQLPSPGIIQDTLMYNIGDDTKSVMKHPQEIVKEPVQKKPTGPRIIKTPVSLRKEKVMRKNAPKLLTRTVVPTSVQSQKSLCTPPAVQENTDGIRSSGRKRKLKQLYPFEEYSYAKFPRLNKNLHDNQNSGH